MDSSESRVTEGECRDAAKRVVVDYLGAGAGTGADLWVFTDPGRRWFAEHLVSAALEMGYRATMVCLAGDAYSAQDLEPVRNVIGSLGRNAVLISAFSDYSMGRIPYFTVFPSFRSPESFEGASAVIRPHYPDDALIRHLQTPVSSADAAAASWLRYSEAGRVRVTSKAGTDLEVEIGRAILLPYKAGDGSRHAYLPPAEVAFAISAGSARGVLVVDVTAGDVVINGKLEARLGLVDRPVEVVIKDGYIEEIRGGRIATMLKDTLGRLGPENRLAVELGFGLSEGVPTGCGSADECLQGTFHIGFGDDSFFNKVNKAPVHLDLICGGPQLYVVS